MTHLSGFIELLTEDERSTPGRGYPVQATQVAATNSRSREVKYDKSLNRNAPISSIPNEILSTIFEIGKAMTQLADLEAEEDGEEDGPAFEVLVSHVTSHWRDVAISTPLLWNRINISPGSSITKVTVYLERSDTCPLDVRLDLSQSIWNPMCMMTGILDMIISHVARWRRFAIDSDRESTHNSVLSRLCDPNLSAPLLEHLSVCIDELEFPGSASNDGKFHPQIFMEGAPRLSFVRLRGLAMHFFRPPLSTVTTLHLDQTKCIPIHYSRLRELLTASPLLRNLSIYGDMIGSELWPAPESNTIEMSALRSLRICGLAGRVYTGILSCISAPRLRSLVLKDVHEHDLDPFWIPSQMTKFPGIQSLTFCDFECSEFTYRNLFYAFPAITKFTLLYSSVNTPVVLKLLRDADTPPWPNLHTLTLLLDLGDEPFIENVVETRMIMEYPLTKLRLGTSCAWPLKRTLAWLRNHVEVERFRQADSWPEGLKYVDEDDILFND